MNFINHLLDLTDIDQLTSESINDAVKLSACQMAGFDLEELNFD
jgi:hypothetical protein